MVIISRRRITRDRQCSSSSFTSITAGEALIEPYRQSLDRREKTPTVVGLVWFLHNFQGLKTHITLRYRRLLHSLLSTNVLFQDRASVRSSDGFEIRSPAHHYSFRFLGMLIIHYKRPRANVVFSWDLVTLLYTMPSWRHAGPGDSMFILSCAG